MGNKLYEVTIEYTILVVAADGNQAESIAESHVNDEEPSMINAAEVSEVKQLMSDWADSYPYRGRSDDTSKDLTCKEFLEKLIDERENDPTAVREKLEAAGQVPLFTE